MLANQGLGSKMSEISSMVLPTITFTSRVVQHPDEHLLSDVNDRLLDTGPQAYHEQT